jgi:hypothetical protein
MFAELFIKYSPLGHSGTEDVITYTYKDPRNGTTSNVLRKFYGEVAGFERRTGLTRYLQQFDEKSSVSGYLLADIETGIPIKSISTYNIGNGAITGGLVATIDIGKSLKHNKAIATTQANLSAPKEIKESEQPHQIPQNAGIKERLFKQDDKGTAMPNTKPEIANNHNFTQSMAVNWDGISNLLAGTITRKNGTNAYIMQLSLPYGIGACDGNVQDDGSGKGVWFIECKNGLSASGTFKGLLKGKTASGEGLDNVGRKVKIAISSNQ